MAFTESIIDADGTIFDTVNSKATTFTEVSIS